MNGRLLQAGLAMILLAPMQSASEVETALHLSGRALHSRKRIGGMPGIQLRFLGSSLKRIPDGWVRIIEQQDTVSGLKVYSHYEFFEGVPFVRRYTRLVNEGPEPVGVEYVSSAMLHNFGDFEEGGFDDKLKIHWAHNTWFAEGQWHTSRPSGLGMTGNRYQLMSGICMSNPGFHSSVRFLPMAMVENEAIGVTWVWQIEHNGSWHWEMLDAKSGYDFRTNKVTMDNQGTWLYLGGPDEEYGHAWKELIPGESYVTVPVALGFVSGGFQEAMEAMIRYRRKALLKDHPDNRACPAIFNDYMNCLMADPDQASFNMVTAMLCRIHMSGRIDRLAPESFQQVKEAVALYREHIQPVLKQSIQFFPLGMPSIADDVSPVAVGLKTEDARFVSVWRLEGDPTVVLPGMADAEASVLYPMGLGINILEQGNDLVIQFPRPYMAAVVKLK